ncbi:MAG: DUF4446 family protein [bacterium]
MFNFQKKEKKEPKNLKEVLKELEDFKEKFKKVSFELETVKSDQKLSVQKIGMIRFNPFRDVGGDQSFSLALLDKNNSGVVVTSLYTRDGNRVYGKPINKGLSEYALSEEEKRAIEEAKNEENRK